LRLKGRNNYKHITESSDEEMP